MLHGTSDKTTQTQWDLLCQHCHFLMFPYWCSSATLVDNLRAIMQPQLSLVTIWLHTKFLNSRVCSWVIFLLVPFLLVILSTIYIAGGVQILDKSCSYHCICTAHFFSFGNISVLIAADLSSQPLHQFWSLFLQRNVRCYLLQVFLYQGRMEMMHHCL